MTRVRRLRSLALVALVTGCALPALPGSSASTAAERRACAQTHGQRVLELVNATRRAHGLRDVRTDLRLVRAALGHSRDQAAQGEGGVGHVGSDGSAPGERVTAAGYAWAMVGENVAAGMGSPDEVVSAWLRSPPHRAIILAPQPVHAGVGYVHSPHGPLGHYWTMKLAAPADPDTAEAAPCHP